MTCGPIYEVQLWLEYFLRHHTRFVNVGFFQIALFEIETDVVISPPSFSFASLLPPLSASSRACPI
jgi:hypothetical protein